MVVWAPGVGCMISEKADKDGVSDKGGSRNEREAWLEKLQFLSDAMESTSQPFGAGSPDGSIIIFNEAYCRLTGYMRDELFNLNWASDLTTPESSIVGLKTLDVLNRTHEPQRYEKYYKRKDGSIVPVELFTHAALGENGDVLFYYLFATDITERKRKEERLQRGNRAYRMLSKCKDAMIRAEDEPTLLKNICGIVVSEGGYRLAWIGYVEDDGPRNVMPVARAGCDEGYVDSLKIALNDPIRGSGPTGISLRLGKPYGSRDVRSDGIMQPWREAALQRGYLSTLNLPIMYEGQILGTLVIYSGYADSFDTEELELLQDLADSLAYGVKALRDQARRDKAEKDLILARDELEMRIKERTKDLNNAKQQAELYLDLMCHDISNMHQAAIGHLELAGEIIMVESRLEYGDKELIDTSLKSLESSARLIDNVRNLQKLHSGELNDEVVDLGTLLREVVKEYNYMLPECGLRFFSAGPHRVRANRLLHDVFSNLLGNAVKHANCDTPVVAIGLDSTRIGGIDFYIVSIDDNGPGVPDEMKDNIFNRLQRGETKARGMGLGLYIVRTLVESYGGYVEVVDRVPGDHTKGAKFMVYLPSEGCHDRE